MSFKKVGINYISDKLLKCLLQDGSKYYVELKNDIRIPVAQADYEAIATDLVVVNGVAYADLSVIASCKQLVGGYIVEFANGNQLTTTELNFNALVAAGFCAIGDTYYNPSQIHKLYEADGAYFAVMANGQRVGMTEEEYEAIVGGEPGPEPTELTQFVDGQTLLGIAIDPNAVPTGYASLAEYVDSVDLSKLSDGVLVAFENDNYAITINSDATTNRILMCFDEHFNNFPVVIWSREQFDVEGATVPAGWSYTNDMQSFTQISSFTELTLTTAPAGVHIVPEFAPLNGVVLGAVVAQ